LEYYEIDNLEMLTESLSKIHFVGLTFFVKNFIPKFTAYFIIRDKKYQFESDTDMPNEATLSVKVVENFSIPLNDEASKYLIPANDDVTFVVCTSADEIDYNEKETLKYGTNSVIKNNFFSVNLTNKLALILNNDKLKEVSNYEFVKKIIWNI